MHQAVTSGGNISKESKLKLEKKVIKGTKTNISFSFQTTTQEEIYEMQDPRGQEDVEEREEFLDLCDKVKQMAEEKARKRKHEEASSGGRPPAPSLMYGPIDWRVPPEKEKEIKEKAMRKVVVEGEDKAEMEDEAVVDEDGMNVDVPKKKGKIKRRGKKKGKRNKPDREEEERKKSENTMDC